MKAHRAVRAPGVRSKNEPGGPAEPGLPGYRAFFWFAIQIVDYSTKYELASRLHTAAAHPARPQEAPDPCGDRPGGV